MVDHESTEKAGTSTAVAVVVLNWNGEVDTRECLGSLVRTRYPHLQVIVVDNASARPFSPPVGADSGQVKVIQNMRNLGFPGGMNVGIRQALADGAEIVICLNNDTVVDPAFITEIVAAHKARPTGAAFAPLELEHDRPSIVVSLGGRIGLVRSTIGYYGEPETSVPGDIQPTKMLCGACIVLTATTVRALGFLTPDYFFGFEDREYGLRILRSGLEILSVPRARLFHKRAQSTASRFNSMRAYFEMRNWILFAKSGFPLRERGKLAFFLTFVYFPYLVYKGSSSGNLSLLFWSVRGVLWHINRNLVQPDDEVARDLARRSH